MYSLHYFTQCVYLEVTVKVGRCVTNLGHVGWCDLENKRRSFTIMNPRRRRLSLVKVVLIFRKSSPSEVVVRKGLCLSLLEHARSSCRGVEGGCGSQLPLTSLIISVILQC